MKTLVDCGCVARVHADGSGIEIDFCHLHTAAPELLEAAKEARKVLAMAIRTNTPGMDFDPAEHLTIKRLDAAIAKAEGRS